MLASTETVPPVARPGLYLDSGYSRSPERALKKHKVLPHPRSQNAAALVYKPRSSQRPGVENGLSPLKTRSATQPSNTQVLKSERRKPGTNGPDPPPTPPAHSRTSSSSHSAIPSSPTFVENPVRSTVNEPVRAPSTPPNQMSPPTPDVTPPQTGRRPGALRPVLSDRIPSKATTESRTESFKTARENPYSSEEEEEAVGSISRPVLPSNRTSQSTVRLAGRPRKSKNVGLGLGLESDDSLTPRTKQEFFTFDGEWGSASEVEQEWDDNLNRNVVVRKRRPGQQANGRRQEVVEDVTVTPTNAAKAVRAIPLHDRLQTQPSPKVMSRGNRWDAPSNSESSISTEVKRSSGVSSKSTVSTVVEAFLVEHGPPKRQKTLRHVKKRSGLRDSGSDASPSSSGVNSLGLAENLRRQRGFGRLEAPKTDSIASTNTVNSLASHKARREVWKNGGIPVVIVPHRKSSFKSAETPSLRSTSSRRSKRSNSLGSVPLSTHSRGNDHTPVFDRPSRRGRTMSESDGSVPGDQRTIDYPPVVPVRTSSLSAPTSRNTSRAGSLTAESLKAHNEFQEQQAVALTQALQRPPQVTVERAPSVEEPREQPRSDQRQSRLLQPAASVESHKDAAGTDHRPLVDQQGDPLLGKRLKTPNTPFSLASVETNGTHSAAEVSEAMAVNIYPHQNKSVLMVDHTPNAADANGANAPAASDLVRETSHGTQDTIIAKPRIMTSNPDGGPVTPPQPQFSMDDVDSPLRNPRDPPAPPAIKFIPATPSGLTPAAEKAKMMGNYFETTGEKRPSLMRRALSLSRRNSEKETATARPGFLTRTLSLTRNIRGETAENPALEKRNDVVLHQYPTEDSPPTDDSKLHPFWRPASQFDYDDEEDGDDWVYDIPDEVDKVYRYPAIDNRPAPPRRSLSERMRRTFAILPIQDDRHYTETDSHGTERRTIRRTPSGNLRVMRYRESESSMRWPGSSKEAEDVESRAEPNDYASESENEGRPSTAPERQGRRLWGIEKKVDGRGRRLFPGWQEKLEMYKPNNLQRRLSEHRRQKRSEVLRQKISGPREVRDGVGEVIKRSSYQGPSYQANGHATSAETNGAEAEDEEDRI